MELPKKERLAAQEIRDKLSNKKIIILSGLRKVGKTTALRQLEKTDDGLYVDCRNKNDHIKIDAFLKKGTGLLLDEFNYHPNCYHLSEEIAEIADRTGMKAVITSSSVHFCNVLSFQTLGGGRSSLVRMPLFTFAEFLFFSDRITSYADLSGISEADWLDYTDYRGPIGLPEIDAQYAQSLVEEINLAYNNYPVYFGDLELSESDVRNALSLLTYNLHYPTRFDKVIDPLIGGKEMSETDRLAFKADTENYNCFSITEASLNMIELVKLNPKQIGKALYFLLWSNLLVATAVNTDFSFSGLPKLDMISKDTLNTLFKDYQFTVVNPLLYSAIVDEPGCMGEQQAELATSLHFLSKKALKTVKTERRLLGHWVETYLRGACANKAPSLILSSKVLRQPRPLGGFYEVDIEDIHNNILIESSVRQKDDSEINFKIFHTNQRCILATKEEEKTELVDGVAVYKIPYYKLAVYLDIKAIPVPEQNAEEFTNTDSCTVISADPYQKPNLT